MCKIYGSKDLRIEETIDESTSGVTITGKNTWQATEQTLKHSKVIWYSCYFLSPCLLQIASSGGHDDFYRFFKILGHWISNLHNSAKSIFSIFRSKVLGKNPLCITASGNFSLKLFMAPLETVELLTF